MVPVVLLAVLLVIQFGLAYYARTVAAGAAQDGAAAAARRGSSPAEGISVTRSLIDQGAGALFESYTVNAATTPEVVTVRVEAKVVRVLPFFGPITVTAAGSARIEVFVPQGASP